METIWYVNILLYVSFDIAEALEGGNRTGSSCTEFHLLREEQAFLNSFLCIFKQAVGPLNNVKRITLKISDNNLTQTIIASN